ncbi:hypothetical protein BDR07DRAFT_1397878 [Suillus spraguei]|nr:hypothetical protein BDR07DRAFT_1397878 [Suillus spraguei]
MPDLRKIWCQVPQARTTGSRSSLWCSQQCPLPPSPASCSFYRRCHGCRLPPSRASCSFYSRSHWYQFPPSRASLHWNVSRCQWLLQWGTLWQERRWIRARLSMHYIGIFKGALYLRIFERDCLVAPTVPMRQEHQG